MTSFIERLGPILLVQDRLVNVHTYTHTHTKVKEHGLSYY